MILLPDILASEKSEIRKIAKKYAQELWTIPFDKGIVAYVKTNNELFVHPARWHVCLLCGEIEHPEIFLDPNHKCTSLSSYEFPLFVKTSWMKLEDFFLSEISLEILKERKSNQEK